MGYSAEVQASPHHLYPGDKGPYAGGPTAVPMAVRAGTAVGFEKGGYGGNHYSNGDEQKDKEEEDREDEDEGEGAEEEDEEVAQNLGVALYDYSGNSSLNNPNHRQAGTGITPSQHTGLSPYAQGLFQQAYNNKGDVTSNSYSYDNVSGNSSVHHAQQQQEQKQQPYQNDSVVTVSLSTRDSDDPDVVQVRSMT